MGVDQYQEGSGDHLPRLDSMAEKKITVRFRHIDLSGRSIGLRVTPSFAEYYQERRGKPLTFDAYVLAVSGETEHYIIVESNVEKCCSLGMGLFSGEFVILDGIYFEAS